MNYFDANTFIYSTIYEDDADDIKIAINYSNQLDSGNIEGCTCALTWDEVFYIIQREKDLETAIEAGLTLLEHTYLIIYPVDKELISEAQSIASNFSVKPRDSIHAACAIKYCDGRIISRDSDLDKIDSIERIWDS